MVRDTIIEIIAKNYKNLTKTEMVVADYFIKNRIKEDFSSRKITAKLFVSESTLSRFAQKCGFHGYREFVYRYEENFIENADEFSTNIEHVLNSYNELLRQVQSIDEKQIERFIEMLDNAEHVLVIGVGSSGLSAYEMKNRFMRLGVRMESVSDVDEMRMKSVFQDEKCLMIGISLSGEKKEVLFSLEQAKANGAKTVIITSNKMQEYGYCDEKIICPAFSNLAQGNMISPQFPILVIVDIFYNYFIARQTNANERKELHKKTVEVLKEI
ncbi:MAG: MurR/RpiR family transcriptional regulator [Clostridia bacterium]